ncbi:MAG TPA: translocation/assembly module TamB domain-containing protein [Chitinophagaceae bacterium]|nr:translocation/assembly module TamB domain-containing protein [Chitinophagaceae bacterium]
MGKAPLKRSRTARISRIILRSFLFLFLFIIFIFLLTLTPPVQRYLTGRVEKFLEKKLQTRVDIDRITFDPFGNVKLAGVYVEDRNKDTLLSGAILKTRVNVFKLFSNKILVKKLELKDINAYIKRSGTDTAFNFQFIVDAFTPKPDPLDTTAATPLEADLKDVKLDNVFISYSDAVSGSEMNIHTGSLRTSFISSDINKNIFVIPLIDGDSITAYIRQVKPLVTPEPLAKDIAEAVQPIPVKLMIGGLDLQAVDIHYANDVSALYADVHIGELQSKQRLMDLQQRKIYFDEFNFANSAITIRMDKKEEAKTIAKEVVQEIAAQQQAGWDIRGTSIRLDSNSIHFTDNNKTHDSYGIDYDHLAATGLTLYIDDLVMNGDSIGGRVVRGAVKDQSGFELEELHGNILYAHNQAYAEDLLIKTPGSEIKRSATLLYASREELAKHFARTVMKADIDNSYIQVKDILAFAPALRRQKAFANPSATWRLDIKGNGTLDRLVLDKFNFSGLSNTQISAHGTLTGISNTKQAGGNFTINHLHTTQTDISLFTGKRLSTANIRIPEDISMSGTIAGNSGSIATRMNITTSSGSANVNGRFANLGNPNDLSYDAVVSTSSLNLGRILQQDQLGILTGNFTMKGTGTTKDNLNTSLLANIGAVDYNQYRYHHVAVNGTIRNGIFDGRINMKDPNASGDLVLRADLDGNSFSVNGMIDSLKTQPLHLTAGPLIARGKIEGSIANITSENLDADLLISNALFVSGTNRLPLDMILLKTGRNDSVNYLTLQSDIASARLSGRYRLSELGTIIQSSIEPYFTTGPGKVSTASLHPYNFQLTAAINYSPVFNSFVPGLSSFDNISAEASVVSGAGINGEIRIPSLVYNGNEFQQLYITAATAAGGLQVNATAHSIKSGSNLALYNTRIHALAMGNNIQFTAATDDQTGRSKYRFSGLFAVTSPKHYTVSLSPDSLLLNYEPWSIAPGNQIKIAPNSITATNFLLQNGNQQLRINSADMNAGSLDVQFTQFRLSTITAFVKNDSLPADGLINGNLTVTNIMKTPAFTGHLLVNDLSLQKDTIGNVDIRVTAGEGNRHHAVATISGRGNDVDLSGYFIPGKDMMVDLDLNVRQLQLASLKAIMAKAMTDATGSMSGRMKIGGKLSDPQFAGEMTFNNASFIPTALGTRFRIGNQKLSLVNDGIVFNNFIIEDSAGNKMILNGRAVSKNFINYDFDVAVQATNFQVLNTTRSPGKIYYGKLNVTADLRIRGTELKPRADGTITVNEGTVFSFVIPQVEEGVSQRKGIVEFVDMDAPENDSLFLAYDSLNYSSILGFDVATTIEIKKEALFNIIIDESNGDFLNVQGEALLSAGVDPSGKVTLAGNYVLDQGSYQISFNFLRRKFDITKGSNIVWTGEPTTAQLDMRAVYVANTAPLDLVSSQLPADANRSYYLQKLPFEVHLNVTGELLKPVIDFDIVLPESNYGVSNDIVTAVQSRLDLMRGDEGEINKQVFSLLLLNRFVGDNPFASAGETFNFNTYARQSVSKLLTEQLNQLAAGLIDGVDINFDVISTDDYTTGNRMSRTDLNVGLSKRLLSNRLKISVGSNFQVEGPQSGNQQSNNIAGNVAVDYQLSRDGRYLIRFYRQNEYQGIVDGYIIETGVSFIFSVDYERFMQIFRKRRRPGQPRSTEATQSKPATQNTPGL